MIRHISLKRRSGRMAVVSGSFKSIPDDALQTIHGALGRDSSTIHFGMPSRVSQDRYALSAVNHRQSEIFSRKRLGKCKCIAWICADSKKLPCFVAQGQVTTKKHHVMCALEEDKTCTFEAIILAIIAAARQVIKEKTPDADRIVVWNDSKLKRDTARHGVNRDSPIMSIDLFDDEPRRAVRVYYGTGIWSCLNVYDLIEHRGEQFLHLKASKPCSKREDSDEDDDEDAALIPSDGDWQRAFVRKLLHKASDVLIASRGNASSHERFKGFLFLRKPA